MRLFLRVVVSLVIVVAVGLGVYGLYKQRERQRVLEARIHHVNLDALADGTYTGECAFADNIYRAEVIVRDHTIRRIELADNRPPDDAYAGKAKAIADRVLELQSPQVDAVSGATLSSKAWLLAIEQALTPAS